MIEIIYLSALILSNLISLFFVFLYRRKLAAMKARPDSVELSEFLTDLLAGGGLVHVKRVSPGDVILRSRRQ